MNEREEEREKGESSLPFGCGHQFLGGGKKKGKDRGLNNDGF